MQTTLAVPRKNGRSAVLPTPKAKPAALADGAEDEFMELRGEVAALGKVHPVIKLDMDGTIITANENFLAMLGYGLEEIKGRNYSMFLEPSYSASAEYKQFWRNLHDGKFQAGNDYKLIAKGGKRIWQSQIRT